MGFKAFVFDMDGTILHTLPDLALATNEALARMGYPTRTYDEIHGFMGQGSNRLIEMSCPENATPAQRARTFDLWRTIYLKSAYAHTEPFPGIVEAIRALREQGVKTAVLSNKFDAGVQVLAQRFFPGLFDAARGELPPTPRKPDPTSLLQLLDHLGVRPSDAVYVGDTNIDVRLAENASIPLIGVSWGYDAAEPMRKEGLFAYIHEASELIDFA